MNFIKKLFERKYTVQERYERSRLEKRFKVRFRYFFEGANCINGVQISLPEVDIPTRTLGITDFKFNHSYDKPKDSDSCGTVIVTVVLLRPGLMIGRHGRTMDKLNDYIDEIDGYLIRIKIEESVIWE